jgi:phosphoglycolate phosphatase
VSLVLFDIDGTLLLSGGAGVRAMTRAFYAVYGVTNAFATSDIAGRTDTFILSHALRAADLPDTPESHERFREAYIPILRDLIQEPPKSRSGLLPGVLALLEHISPQPAFHLGLLTGNFQTAAFIKLDHFGIGKYFEWGAFGDESAEREDLARVAVHRAQERAVPLSDRARTIIVGDTPHDVACARAIGARVLAVATGGYSIDALTEASADVVMPDLSDLDAVVQTLR